MAFWDAYRASLKPSAVEETIDVIYHRPLGYIVARLAFPTPISPNQLTVLSALLGIAAGICIIKNFPYHLQIAGLLISASAIVDCSDGQLARMRKSSSPFGRMLDGMADLVVIIAVGPVSCFYLWRQHPTPLWWNITLGVACIATLVTSSFHTGMYDHYKNVWLRLTTPNFKEGEDHAAARVRWEQARPTHGLFMRLFWQVYLFYTKSQEDYVRKFDPHTVPAISQLPLSTPEIAAIYEKHAAAPMAWFRRWFGFGSLVFGLTVMNLFEVHMYFLVFRLIVLNAVFYLYLRPLQLKASREALAEIEALGTWQRPESVTSLSV
jgi:phosphatidylglycerophosphate synthase